MIEGQNKGLLPDLPAGMTAYPVDPAISLGEFERRIASGSVEVAGAFDLEGRLVVRPRIGTQDGVDFAQVEADAIHRRIVTHNHPDGYPISAEDVGFARAFDLAELRAVCPDGTAFSLQRPSEGWPSSDKMSEVVEATALVLRNGIRARREMGMPPFKVRERVDLLFASRRDALAALGVVLRRTSVWERE